MDAKSIMISNSPQYTNANWENYVTEKNWRINESEGENTVYLKLKYINDSIAYTKDKIVLDVTRPKLEIILFPDSGIANETIFNFNPQNSTDNISSFEKLKIRYDFENDGIYNTDWSSLEVKTHLYKTGGGTKYVKIKLRDEAGMESDTLISIFVNSRPNASFKSTEDINNLLKWHFAIYDSYDIEDQSNLKYQWDF